jgi:MarR family 2-MHQ and catechol resistance regulon transcriptional repressor
MPTHFKGNSEQVLALNTFIKFTRSVESLENRLIRRNTIGDLTISQFGVLETLYHLGHMSQSEICGKLLKSGGNITLVIDNLEKRGLARRQVDAKDRRVTTVLLTEKGEELIGRIFPEQVKAIVEELSVLTANEQETLGGLCKKLGKQEKEI